MELLKKLLFKLISQVFNASVAGIMMNRKTSVQGIKTAGQTWRLTLEITLS